MYDNVDNFRTESNKWIYQTNFTDKKDKIWNECKIFLYYNNILYYMFLNFNFKFHFY